MKAIIAYPRGKGPAQLAEIPRPKVGGCEVLLRTSLIGIDGTDREIDRGIYGTPPEGCPYLVLGHEAVGMVEEVGNEVEDVPLGAWVVPTVRRPDGCINCRTGESDMCLTGDYKEHGIYRLHGFASEYAPTNSEFLVEVPQELVDEAVLLEPLSIGEKAYAQAMRIQGRMTWEPKRALVAGAGPLGLLTAMILRLRDLEVFVVATRGSDSLKAEIVRGIGGTYVNIRETPIRDMKEEFDIIMEATGKVEPAVEAAGRLARNGVMCLLGNYRDSGVWRNLEKFLYGMVLGNRIMFGSVNSNKDHFRMGLKDMQRIKRSFREVLQRLVTKRVGLEEYREAFTPDREDIKIVIDFKTE